MAVESYSASDATVMGSVNVVEEDDRLVASAKIAVQIDHGLKLVTLTSTAILTFDRETDRGLLVKSLGTAWIDIVRVLGGDWNKAYQIDARTWEKILAGALTQEGFQVILTPPSGDHGSD